MELVYPKLLWLLSLLIIPVLIHLFHFRRYKTLFFSSLKFIKFIEQENKSTKKLKNLLILFARLLALTSIILAFAQPIIQKGKLKHSAGKNVLAIYIDNSFSMSAKGSEGELISEARELARRLLKNTPLETAILLATNKLDGIEQRLISKIEALDYLDKIELTPINRNLEDVINWQRTFLDKENLEQQKLANRQYVLLSDFQNSTFIMNKIAEDKIHFYNPIQLFPQDRSNIYIDSVWFSSPIHKKGEANELFIQIKNDAEEASTNLELELEIGKKQRTSFIDIDAGKKSIISFQITDQENGQKNGKVGINDKQLYWDDDFYFSYRVADYSNTLIINGEAASENVTKVFNIEPFFKTQSTKDVEFTKDKLNQCDFVILNGLNSISSGMDEDLVEFNKMGGSIFIFPGNNIDFLEYRHFLKALNLPELGPFVSTGLKIDQINFKDPFFKGVFEKENKNLNLPSVTKSYSSRNLKQETAFPLISFRNGAPLLLKSKENAYLFLSSLNTDFGNFIGNALFPTILLRAGELSTKNYPLFALIGEENSIAVLDPILNDQALKLIGNNSEFIPIIQKIGNQNFISISGMEAIEKLKAGNFSIQTDDEIGLLALNYSRKESELDYKNEKEILDAFKNKGISNCQYEKIENGQSSANIEVDKPYEYWKLFLVLGLFFITSEIALLRFMK
jgi:hypothetical protein